ncbi:SDR family NAD(P)-dependent oxidoreductase [Paenibacillus albidus]|uniref:SDR family NAD(P)-dependent oxidoreductase n=1 Tax=Paenibacillus albidus TaxID=2041023 RepID=UPI001BEB8456|nr:SDR family NAD(P)-dependent oxidoreductase [Paenibacillus albidus]MBT2290845.1 SDR family NAD(P)-dependent oxidoreductase [Paenibacillus albidus]
MKNQNQTAMITGANSGVGFELTKRLLSEQWHVIALIRSDMPRSEPLITEALSAGRLRIYKADLSSFGNLKRALSEIKGKEAEIDVLFNNAGVSTGELTFSVQGRELDFEVNSVVPYIIYREMKELLSKGALKTVINTSSNSLLFVKSLNPEQLGKAGKHKKLFGSYASSKMALSLWTQEEAQAAADHGIYIRSVCPGSNKTTMTAGSGMPKLLLVASRLFFKHPSTGAARLYEAAFGEHRSKNGIFINKGQVTPLKFSGQAKRVLSIVNGIYTAEFLHI